MDIKKLENFEAVVKFFDFLANPQEYKKIVEDARKAVKEFDEMTLKARAIKDVDVFRAEKLAELDKKEAEIAVRKAQQEAAYESKVKALEERSVKLSDHEKANALRVDIINREEQRIKNAAVILAEVEAEKARLEEDKANFRKQVVEFERKAAVLEAALRG